MKKINGVLPDKAALTCLILGSLGLSTKLISEKTGLTESQVNYRLYSNKFYQKVLRRDYTNGRSKISQHVIKQSTDFTARAIQSQIIKQLNE